MISITEKIEPKRYPKERSYSVPPWVTVPAAGGAAGLGALHLAKKTGEGAVEVVKGSVEIGSGLGAKTGEYLARKTRQFGGWLKDTGQETGRRFHQLAKDLQIKGRETPWLTDGKMDIEKVVSIALLNELKKINAAMLKKKAGMRALSKGQPKLLRDPSNKIARAQVDGGNRLVFGAVGKKPYMRTVS